MAKRDEMPEASRGSLQQLSSDGAVPLWASDELALNYDSDFALAGDQLVVV